MNPIKTFLLLFLSTILFCCDGCVDEPAKGGAKPNRAPLDVFIFIDKSKSVNFNQRGILDKAKKQVTAAINKLNQGHDQLLIYFIHGNTVGSAADVAFTIPDIELPKGANKIERNKYLKKYKKQVKEQKSQMVEAIVQRLLVNNETITSTGTDIVGALQVISNSTNPSHTKYIVLLTDGIQTSKQLNNGSVTNPQFARSLAERHVAAVNNHYTITKERLKNTEAVMVLPYNAMASSHNQYLDDYWRRFFGLYNMKIKFE